MVSEITCPVLTLCAFSNDRGKEIKILFLSSDCSRTEQNGVRLLTLHKKTPLGIIFLLPSMSTYLGYLLNLVTLSNQ